MSRWLDGAGWDNGLFIPGRGSRRSHDLRMTSVGVDVIGRRRSFTLDWDNYSVGASCWYFAAWDQADGGPIGVALRGTDAVLGSSRLALDRRWFIGRGTGAEISTMQALGALLQNEPQRRQHLDDEARVDTLANDLADAPQDALPHPSGIRRLRTDVAATLRILNYQHPHMGRPLPWQVHDPVNVLAAVNLQFERLPINRTASPERDEEIETLVREMYLDVEPWPFAALAN